jgi:hypothetical protein
MEERVMEELARIGRGEEVDLTIVIPEEELDNYCEAAKALTADRTTKGLPVIVAQMIFAFSFAISYYQTFSAPLGPGNWWTIEIHSIGMCHKHPRRHLLTTVSLFSTRDMGYSGSLLCVTNRRLTDEGFNAEHSRETLTRTKI